MPMAPGPVLASTHPLRGMSPRPTADPVQALDVAVQEIFEQMLCIACVAQPAGQEDARPVVQDAPPQPVSAIMGFAGNISGSCTLRARPTAVAAISHHLLAMPLPPMDALAQDANTLDNTMLDAFGELCNMVAGGWKNHIPGLDSGCSLSMPTIVYGANYVLHTMGDRVLVERTYLFGEFQMQITIRCDAHTRLF